MLTEKGKKLVTHDLICIQYMFSSTHTEKIRREYIKYLIVIIFGVVEILICLLFSFI